MTQNDQYGLVVVGTDGTLRARRAVRVAADLAARRGRRLRIVVVVPEHKWRAIPRPLSPADIGLALSEAADLADTVLDPESVETVTLVGDPVAVLQEQSRTADLIVLGNRGRGVTSSAIFGSLGVDLAARASCPVLLVREPGETRTAYQGPAPIVVGVEHGSGDEHALEVAFALAEEENAPLVAVHTWTTPVMIGPAGAAPMFYDHGERPADEAALLSSTLAPLQAQHPTVMVRQHVVERGASLVLVDASIGARMLVVGSRGRGAVAGLILGSVSQDVIHHAHCPVLIVPVSAQQPTAAALGVPRG
jgi:nucleotide-binding universal stress UspA family protein